jgi:hypothetical protein
MQKIPRMAEGKKEKERNLESKNSNDHISVFHHSINLVFGYIMLCTTL